MNPTHFTVQISGETIELSTLDVELAVAFEDQVVAFCTSRAASRWPAIYTAMKAGIAWPQLDCYLAECTTPWRPYDYVFATTAQCAWVSGREQISRVLKSLSDEACELLLSLMSERFPPTHAVRFGPAFTEKSMGELIEAGLARCCADDPAEEFLRCVPFPEIKKLFSRAGLKTPRGYDASRPNLPVALAKAGIPDLRSLVARHIEQRLFFEACFKTDFTREDFLSVRTRANYLVSTLVMLNFEEGGREVLRWRR